MINNEKELIVKDILKLRKKKKYEIDDLEIFLNQFKSDLMKKYLKGLIESEPESQLRATLLNSETPLFKWIFGENILTETHSKESTSRAVDNVAEFEDYGRIGIEIKPFYRVEKKSKSNQIILKNIDLEKISKESRVINQIRMYLFSTNLTKEYVILTNIDYLYIYSKSSVISQGEKECLPIIKLSFNDFLKDFKKIEDLPRYVDRIKQFLPKLPLDDFFLKDLTLWVKKISSLNFANSVSDDEKLKFSVDLINKFIFIQTLDLYWVIERDKIIKIWKNLAAYKSRKKEFITLFLNDILRFFWDFYDTELFKIGEKREEGVKQYLSRLEDSSDNISKFYNTLKYILGIKGSNSQRGILQYNFKDIDSDILGKAYENFLAYEHRQKGIYYTPPFITHFISESVLKQKFKSKIKELEIYLENNDFLNALKILENIKQIRILDPACGSGSFLIKVYDIIWDQYLEIKNLFRKKFKSSNKNKQLILEDFKTRQEDTLNPINLIIEEMMNFEDDKKISMLIALRHIFGNDFDSNATDVAKLNLLIAIIKKNPKSYKPEFIISNHVLPFLKINFSNSNFLVNASNEKIIEFLSENRKSELENISRIYHNFLSQPNRVRLADNIIEIQDNFKNVIIKEFKLEELFDNTETIPYMPFIDNWFLFFEDNGELKPEKMRGFDIILGNPPYISLRDLEQDYHEFMLPFLELFEVHTGYNDLFYYFIEQGIKYLKKEGVLSLITTSYFFQATYSDKLRNFILNKSEINLILDFKDFRVFPKQGIHSCVFILKNKPIIESMNKIKIVKVIKCESNGFTLINYIKSNFGKHEYEDQYITIFSKNQKALNDSIWVFVKLELQEILKKIETDTVSLEEVCDIEKGTSTGLNKVFIISKEFVNLNNIEINLLKKYVRNSDLDRYFINYQGLFLVYILNPSSLESSHNLNNYLLMHKDELSKRNEVKKGMYHWTRLERPRVESFYESSEKIITPYRSPYNKFVYDDQQYFGGGDTCHIILKEECKLNIKFILSILNSKLMNFYFSYKGRPKGKMKEYLVDSLSPIPIKIDISKEDNKYALLIDYVDEIRNYKIQEMILRGCFAKILENHLFDLKTSLLSLYEIGSEYNIDKSESILSPIFESEGIVQKISVNQEDGLLNIKIREEGDLFLKDLIRIFISDDNILNFLELSIDLFISSSKKKKFSRNNLNECLKLKFIPQKAKLPESNRMYINELMKDVKKEFKKQLMQSLNINLTEDSGFPNLSSIKRKIITVDNEIDRIIFQIYNLDEVSIEIIKSLI